MKKTTIFAAIAIALLCTAGAAGGGALSGNSDNVPPFPDVSASDWFYDCVKRLADEGIVEGNEYGLFEPGKKVTRAEYIKMAVCAAVGEQPAGERYWADGYIEKAIETGIIQRDNYPEGEFDRPISRNRMAKIAVNCATIFGGDSFPDEGALKKYEQSIPDFFTQCCEYCRPYIAAGYELGILGGYEDGSFNGYGTLTKAEACASLVRVIDRSARLAVGEEQ